MIPIRNEQPQTGYSLIFLLFTRRLVAIVNTYIILYPGSADPFYLLHKPDSKATFDTCSLTLAPPNGVVPVLTYNQDM